jgi:hypothetical protein
MSWLAAMHVLKSEVIEHHLLEFNTEAQSVDSKWRPAKTTDGLGLMKEHDFLDRVASISMVGRNVKDELQKCLRLRNSCGHPNSLKLGANAVAGGGVVKLVGICCDAISGGVRLSDQATRSIG